MLPNDQDSVKSKAEPSLQGKVASQEPFSIERTLEEAWVKIGGFKRYFWLAFLVFELFIMFLFGVAWLALTYIIPAVKPILVILFSVPYYVIGMVSILFGLPEPSFILFFILLALILILPLLTGLQMMCIAYVAGRPYRVMMIFDYFRKPLRYWLAYLWIGGLLFFTVKLGFYFANYFASDVGLHQGFGVLSYIFFVPLIATICLYFMISYSFTLPLLADKKLRTWQALETSRSTVSRHFTKVFGCLLLMMLAWALPEIAIQLLATLVHPLFSLFKIIYIWLTPFYMLTNAIIYRDIFKIRSL